MSATLILGLALVAFVGAYFTYGRYIRDGVLTLRLEAKTPAHKYSDGMDYVPTNRSVAAGKMRG